MVLIYTCFLGAFGKVGHHHTYRQEIEVRDFMALHTHAYKRLGSDHWITVNTGLDIPLLFMFFYGKRLMA